MKSLRKTKTEINIVLKNIMNDKMYINQGLQLHCFYVQWTHISLNLQINLVFSGIQQSVTETFKYIGHSDILFIFI